ncbi:MAG: carbamate kinase [Acholeplasmataceae bacterium]|jgi:carbamate kinase|nr:carbamate kinase [Acholeplasmataceae bacterium]
MKIVVALGGNALGDTPNEQLELVKHAASSVADLVEQGHSVVVVHGNGPQVGMIQNAFDTAHDLNSKVPLMPLPECGAMSQGYIGYHLQNAIYNALLERKQTIPVATIITQALVDPKDPAFDHPSKPIGRFYTKEEAEVLAKETGLPIIDDSGRGYRFVVPSPKPIDIVEKQAIKELIDKGYVVVASGGGGIPVIKDETLKGVAAVIDKDFSSAKLAELIKADVFIILTAVKRVSVNFRKPNELEFSKLSVKEAQKYIHDQQFGKGSMEPKIIAAVSFVEANPKGQAIIAALEDAALAVKGKAGTIIYA